MTNAFKQEFITITESLKEFLRELRAQYPRILKKNPLEIYLAEVPNSASSDHAVVEVKFQWKHVPNMETWVVRSREILGKLKACNAITWIHPLDDFISEFQSFHDHFLEFRHPWKVVDWRCYYQRDASEENTLLLLDNRKALIKRLTVKDKSKTPLSTLKHEVTKRLNQQFHDAFDQHLTRLERHLESLQAVIDFSFMLQQLQLQVASTVHASLQNHWQKLLENPHEKDPFLLPQMAFLLRFTIEFLVKQHYQHELNSTAPLSLGLLIQKLQDKGKFKKEKKEIEFHLSRLNTLIHANDHEHVTREDLIETKQFFTALLSKEGIDFPF